MRLLVARCEVSYTGRLDAFLPEAVRLLMIKSDGSVLVHADSGGYQPSNWMTPPTVIEESDGLIVVRKRAARARTGWRSGSPRCCPTRSTSWTKSRGSRRTASRRISRKRLPRRPAGSSPTFASTGASG